MTTSLDIISHPFTVILIRDKAAKLCRWPEFSTSDFDDLCQSMRLYLIAKSHQFDPERTTIEAFVSRGVRTWMRIYVRYKNRFKRRKKRGEDLSLDGTVVECADESTTLASLLTSEDGRRRRCDFARSPIDQFERREAVEYVMQHMASHDRALLEHVAEHGVKSAARQFHISRRQILKTIARLRINFEKVGLNHG